MTWPGGVRYDLDFIIILNEVSCCRFPISFKRRFELETDLSFPKYFKRKRRRVELSFVLK